jgi:hypothetical protein
MIAAPLHGLPGGLTQALISMKMPDVLSKTFIQVDF